MKQTIVKPYKNLKQNTRLNKHDKYYMDTVHVVKKDEATAQIHCERGILYELSQYLRFKVPGYQHMPRYKAGIWDGDIRLIDIRDQTIPIGLVPRLADIIKEADYECVIDDSMYPSIGVSREELQRFISNIPLTVDSETINPFDYQFETVLHALENEKCLLLSPTSSGKSLIFYLISRYLLDTKQSKKILLTVPLAGLVKQMGSDFADYSETDEWDAEDHVHSISAGAEHNTDKEIVISTWQSIYKKPAKWFDQFDVWICDEAHLAKGTSLQNISKKLRRAKVRVGATGTLDGEKVHKYILEGSFGPVYNIVGTKELIDKGTLTKIKIECLQLLYNNVSSRTVTATVKGKRFNYQDEIKFLINHEGRNKFISNLAGSRKGNTLVLVSRVETHGQPLYERIKEQFPDKQVYMIDRKQKVEVREEVRRITEENDDVIIVATYQIFSTGINIKNLHNIIFASPTKGKIRVLQSIGRLLRKHASKDIAFVYDIIDDLRYGKKMNYSLKHYIQRAKIYAEQGFQYAIHKVKLER